MSDIKIKALWESTLAKDFPPHPAGSRVSACNVVDLKNFGNIGFTAFNPVCFYFKESQKNLENWKKALNKIVEELPNNKQFEHTNRHPTVSDISDEVIIESLSCAMLFIVFLFCGIEAFVNQILPNYPSYEIRISGKKRKFNSREDVVRYVSTKDKLMFLNSKINRESFWGSFIDLKSIRDEVVHLKQRPKSGEAFTEYTQIYQDLIDGDLGLIFESQLNLIKFFSPNFFD